MLGFNYSIQVLEVLEPTLDYGGALSKTIGKAYAAQYDTRVFAEMARSTDEYNGGSWKMVKLDNGAFFLLWDTDLEQVTLKGAGNYSVEQMTPVGASIAVNLMVQNQLIWAGYPSDAANTMNELYYKLRDASFEHEDSSAVVAFTD